MLSFTLTAHRNDASSSTATAKATSLELDTSVLGRADALNPVELLLAAQAACFIKGVGRLAPLIDFDFVSVSVELTATRPEDTATISRIDYRIWVDTNEPDSKLDLLHKNLQRQGTIYNVLSRGTQLQGELIRGFPDSNL